MNNNRAKFSSIKYNKIKIIASDMVINIIASIVPVFIMQFFLLPKVAYVYDENQYGLMLTLISLVTLFVQPFSVSLGNSRLILNHEYEENGFVGDFNILLIGFMIINIILISIGTYLYEKNFNFYSIALIICISTSQLIRRYLLVSFRLKIYYKGVLYSNILLIAGYVIGMILFLLTKTWQLIYLAGEILSLIYILTKTKLLKDPIIMTPMFRKTSRHGLVMLLASFLGTAITQVDKLLLYPMLGANMVTVYYVSTLFGKTISMLVGPINNVILTYLSKMKKFEIDSFRLMLASAVFFGAISYMLILLISEPILTIIYPLYVNEAMNITNITTMTAIVMMLSNVINPVIIKFCNISWQIWTNILNILVYLGLAYYLVNLFQIKGFCLASLIAAIFKLLLLIWVYIKNQNNIKQY